MSEGSKGPKGPPEKDIVIHIDHKQYKVSDEVMTGLQLRSTAVPPISQDYDVWLDVPGPDDEKVSDLQPVALRNGMHFYSVLREINPGATCDGLA